MRKTKSFPLFAAVAVATALAATVTAAPAGAKTGRSTAGISCSGTIDIGVIAPLTGGAGFLGQQQLSWIKYAVKSLVSDDGPEDQARPGRHPRRAGPGESAQPVAQKIVADKNLVGVIGPSTSGTVASASKTLTQAGILHISPSATRTTLTKGNNQEAGNAFYRDVPADDIQGPTDAKYMINTLQGQERRGDRLPGAVLAGPCRRRRAGAQGGRRDGVAPVDPEHRDGLLELRHQRAELGRHRVLPDAEAG